MSWEASAMQSTKASDKRADSRHDCRIRLTLQEETAPDNRLQAVALNASRGGVLIEVARPLWPGMEFDMRPEPATAPVEWPGESATVRWCIVERMKERKAVYLAGLQFRLPAPVARSAGRLRVIACRPMGPASPG
jgi:hypothetical protein